jgi:hypothetical protein
MLLIWGAILALPPSFFRDFLLVDELMFFAMALLDRVIPKSWPLKRYSSPVRAFLAMNAAAVLSLAVFFVPAANFWKQPTQVVAGSPDPQRDVTRRKS